MNKCFYKLYEIGFDTSIETGKNLINIAQYHCSSYDDDEREKLLPIDTIQKAINYFNNYGFKVTVINKLKGVKCS